MAQVFPKTMEVPQLQYIDKVVDVVVVQVVQVRSVPETCEASTGAVLGHVFFGTRPCDHATTSSCSLLNCGRCHRFSSSPRMVEIPVRNRDRYAQCNLCIVQGCGAAGDMAVGGVAAMREILPHFEAFFALRRVPVGGDARSLTPRCSATLIWCTHAAISAETSLLHHVRTTTTTTPPPPSPSPGNASSGHSTVT